jgi:arylsulfatase A-like enzyme
MRAAPFLVSLVALALLAGVLAAAPAAETRPPDILFVTVDTLRYDHLSINGHPRPLTPRIDRLLSSGVRFTQARTVEPLTSPAMCSLFTSLSPHAHGSTRNGLRMRPGLVSLPKLLAAKGWRTAAFISNWTLRNKLSGLGPHFGSYHEVLTEKRWLGMLRSESSAPGMTQSALDWVDGQPDRGSRPPLFLWVHYSDPHAPYELREEQARALGIPLRGKIPARDRYATEVAWTDAAIGALLDGLEERGMRDLIVIFAADHGESLGENGYWGHGNNLREPGLRIPMGYAWKGRVGPATIEQAALISDLAPTVLGLLNLPSPRQFEGYDWSGVTRGEAAPASRVTYHEVHRGAVMARHASQGARRSGLLEVAAIARGRKEILSMDGPLSVFDLRADPAESAPVPPPVSASRALTQWLRRVQAALSSAEAAASDADLSDEDLEKLKALGYVE